MGSLLSAVQFLTTIPIPARPSNQAVGLAPVPFHRTVAWFPTVGAILGCALTLLDAALSILLPSGVTAVLLVVAWLALTGALHLDGLMDAADGLLCHAEPARRLEIMRDVAHGTFGIAAALGVVLTKYVSLAALAGGERGLT
ncbi:MAG: adenosylcobinamide-GDP ribazoletransferase, partial [Chloroflexi bacterium]|nr:adenosylcobinamide-GDP ribazoletransferase [Chloroflexota bacterium]